MGEKDKSLKPRSRVLLRFGDFLQFFCLGLALSEMFKTRSLQIFCFVEDIDLRLWQDVLIVPLYLKYI